MINIYILKDKVGLKKKMQVSIRNILMKSHRMITIAAVAVILALVIIYVVQDPYKNGQVNDLKTQNQHQKTPFRIARKTLIGDQLT